MIKPTNKTERRHSAYLKAYIRLNKKNFDDELKYLKKCNSLSKVIERSACALKSNGQKAEHQKRIKMDTLKTMAKKLLQRENDIRKAKAFDEIKKIIEDEKIPGFGELAIYDTSLRIGAKLNVKPKHVYLHAGTKEGVQSLGITVKRKTKIGALEMPTIFHNAIKDGTLEEMHLEDLFCIYKKRLIAK